MDLLAEFGAGKRRLHFTLIDPDSQSPKEAGMRAALAKSYGSDAIMVGGSTVRDRKLVYDTVEAIKKSSGLKTILFPNSAESLSSNADYVFYMMLMNSLDRRFLLGEQLKGVSYIKEHGIKPISMGYIIVSMSSKPTTVEKAANLDRITENDVGKAVSYALASEFLGMDCVYLEAGSGAEKPVPDEMIKAVREAIKIPIIVGGGVRDGPAAKAKTGAGADVIVNGTVGEEDAGKIREIIKSMRE